MQKFRSGSELLVNINQHCAESELQIKPLLQSWFGFH